MSMKTTILALTALCLLAGGCGEEKASPAKTPPDTSWATWNQQAGKFDLEPGAEMTFGSVSTEGLAPVRYRGKYGYIDKMGDIIIELKYNQAYMFRNGKAKVVLDRETFYINHEGKKVE